MKNFANYILLVLVFAINSKSYTQNHSNGVDFLIEGIKYPDFTYAGIPGGITTSAPGATYNVMDYQGTDKEKVQKAIDVAAAVGGGIVYLPEGTYYFNDYVLITSDNIIVRGDGMDKTKVILQNCSKNEHNYGAFTFQGGGTDYSVHRVDADVDKGDRLIVLDNNYGYKPNDFLLLRVHQDDGIGSNDFYRKKYILYREEEQYDFMHQVVYQVDTAYDNKIVLTQPIRISFRKSPPQAIEKGSAYITYARKIDVLKNCGIEDLRIETEKFTDGTMYSSSIAFTSTYNCWAKNVYTFRTGSHPINFRESKNVEVVNCTFDKSWNTGGGGNGYLVFWTVHDALMEGVTTDSLRHAPNLQSYAGGCVVRNSYFKNSDAQWHGRWTHENIYENLTVTSEATAPPSYILYSNELSDNIASHEPHLHGNIVYNCDFNIERAGAIGWYLGGLYKDWVFAYNRSISVKNKSMVILGDYNDGVMFKSNNFGLSEENGFESGIEFVIGWDTTALRYRTGVSHNKNIQLIDNNFYGIPETRLFRNSEPDVNINTNVFPTYVKPERPVPAIPSIFDYQKEYKEKQPLIKITNPLIGNEFKLGDTIIISTIADLNSQFGSLEKIEFFFDTVKIGEVTEEPYSLEWISNHHSRKGFKRIRIKAHYQNEIFTRHAKIKIAPPYYNLITSGVNGEITVTPSSESYAAGDEVIIKAEGDLGWGFDHWSGDISGNENPFSFVVDSNMSITANYKTISTYSLKTEPENGIIKLSPPGGEYNNKKKVQLEAIPFPAYVFDYWGGDLEGNTNPAEIIMNSNKVVTATFKLDPDFERGPLMDYTDPVGTGIITGRAEQNSDESLDKAFDNLYKTNNWSKWLDNAGVPTSMSPSWIQIVLPREAIVNKLVIVSANDVEDRDPRDFRLKASNNQSVNWDEVTPLESWQNELFTSRFQYREFPFTNETPYSIYRLEITANRGNAPLTQLSEILLFGPSGFYQLSVENGTGDGYYPPESIIDISAEPPSTGAEFVRWSGDISFIADTLASTTSLTMPDQNIVIEALFSGVNSIVKNEKQGFLMYPNPLGSGNLTIKIGGITDYSDLQVSVYSLDGRLVNVMIPEAGNTQKNHLKIPVEFFKGRGLFLIRISGKDWTTCQLVRLE